MFKARLNIVLFLKEVAANNRGLLTNLPRTCLEEVDACMDHETGMDWRCGHFHFSGLALKHVVQGMARKGFQMRKPDEGVPPASCSVLLAHVWQPPAAPIIGPFAKWHNGLEES